MLRYLLVAVLVASVACSPNQDEGSTRPPVSTATPEPDPVTEAAEDLSRADAIFEQEIPKYRFDRMPASAERPLARRFTALFGGVNDVDVAIRRVHTDDGGFVPVRIVAVSYTLPEGVPFRALASEVGREFLGATPKNASDFAGGRGVYMETSTRGKASESVAFFIGEDVFVYAFGIGRATTPTEEISKALLDAND